MSKQVEMGKVISQEMLQEGIYSLWIKTEIGKVAVPGQFVSLFSRDGAKKLPRPISLCEIDAESSALRLVYRVVGKGTEELSRYRAGDEIKIMGPLGNGFPLEGCQDQQVILVGGGIGVPPMLETAKALSRKGLRKQQIMAVMGYRDSHTFLTEEFQKVATLVIATDDGSLGTQGTVIDAMNAEGITGDRIFSCGPKPMLRGVKAYGLEHQIETYVSMEERMACGVGACLGCVCQSTDVDEHSQVKNKRVCKDGPVFLSTEVELS